MVTPSMISKTTEHSRPPWRSRGVGAVAAGPAMAAPLLAEERTIKNVSKCQRRGEKRSKLPSSAVQVMCCTIMCCTIMCCTIMCCTIMCCTIMCCTIMCCTIMCCTIMCCTIMYNVLAFDMYVGIGCYVCMSTSVTVQAKKHTCTTCVDIRTGGDKLQCIHVHCVRVDDMRVQCRHTVQNTLKAPRNMHLIFNFQFFPGGPDPRIRTTPPTTHDRPTSNLLPAPLGR